MSDPEFIPVTVLKRDAFSETISGHLADQPERRLALRKLDALPFWSRPIAWFLARREAKALRAVRGIEGCPTLLTASRKGILRDWSDGTPLQLAKPSDAAFYRDAKRLLRQMRRRGVTHNDIAKPQNWLMTPDGRAAVIDFQLASVHRRRGALFRTMAREDLRHLLKQKRAYAPDLLTRAEHAMLNRKALPARIWMATAKPLYNYVTRRLLNWSDGEGTEDRLERDGPIIGQALDRPDVRAYYTCAFALPGKGVGLYTFVETNTPEADLRRALPDGLPEHLQPVARLPRTAENRLDEAVLSLIAANRLDEVALLTQSNPDLDHTIAPILADRRNLTDRILRT